MDALFEVLECMVFVTGVISLLAIGGVVSTWALSKVVYHFTFQRTTVIEFVDWIKNKRKFKEWMRIKKE